MGPIDVPRPRGPIFVFGEYFLRKFYTVFDRDRNVMGFSVANHNAKDINYHNLNIKTPYDDTDTDELIKMPNLNLNENENKNNKEDNVNVNVGDNKDNEVKKLQKNSKQVSLNSNNNNNNNKDNNSVNNNNVNHGNNNNILNTESANDNNNNFPEISEFEKFNKDLNNNISRNPHVNDLHLELDIDLL